MQLKCLWLTVKRVLAAMAVVRKDNYTYSSLSGDAIGSKSNCIKLYQIVASVLMPHIQLVSISKSLFLDSFSVTYRRHCAKHVAGLDWGVLLKAKLITLKN